MEPKRKSRIRDIRKAFRMTTEDLAKAIGVAPNYISRLEHGKESCGELTARRLGEYFKLNWKQFLSVKYD